MYTLGGGIDEERGWGRTDESFRLKEELAAYGVGPGWFGSVTGTSPPTSCGRRCSPPDIR
ncbi:hypothetical protein ACR6C2_19210 [Streptomyces sp. INA 01156]